MYNLQANLPDYSLKLLLGLLIFLIGDLGKDFIDKQFTNQNINSNQTIVSSQLPQLSNFSIPQSINDKYQLDNLQSALNNANQDNAELLKKYNLSFKNYNTWLDVVNKMSILQNKEIILQGKFLELSNRQKQIDQNFADKTYSDKLSDADADNKLYDNMKLACAKLHLVSSGSADIQVHTFATGFCLDVDTRQKVQEVTVGY